MAQKLRFGGWVLLAGTLVWGSVAAQEPVPAPKMAMPGATRLNGDWRSDGRAQIAAAMPSRPQGMVVAGAVSAAARLDRVLLLLDPTPEQRQALDAMLSDQQNAKSANFHHWMTAAQFADKYANSPSDVAAVAAWLESEGMIVAPLPEGHGWIEFSGTVGQLEQAFQTRVQAVEVRGATRLTLAGPLSVPAALRPLIHGLVSLDGAVAEPAITTLSNVAKPTAELRAATSLAGSEGLTPQLAGQLLHLDALHATGADGAGETIAIAARSSVNPQDVAAFRKAFGLSDKALRVVPNGADPGLAAAGDDSEALMSATWAGVAAPGAEIVVVPAATTSATDGLDLSLAAIIDGAIAHTVAVGFSACEASMSESRQAFFGALYRQAAAEGIAVIAASGDSGASACHASGDPVAVTSGYAVNALASTPWNTAVGAAEFSSTVGAASTVEPGLTGWSPRDPADPAYAGGGGGSALYAVPGWQPIPATRPDEGPGTYMRLTPDLSLPVAGASAKGGLVFCMARPSAGISGSCNAVRAGGSGASAALFAGVAAIIAAKDGPQGNLAPELYEVSRRAGIFQDVEQGDARLACAAGSPGCDASGRIGYEAVAGYDLATGLGSIDAQKLVENWARPAATGTGTTSVLLTVTPAAQNNTYNPSAQITFNASVSSLTGGATPTGTVTFSDTTASGVLTIGGAPLTLDSGGKASVTISGGLPVGGNNVTAIYSGDATYANNMSTPPFVVTIAKSQTTPSITAPSTVAAGASLPVTVTITAGTPPAGTAPPSGAVTMAVDGVAVATANLTTTAGVTSATFTLTAPTTSGSHNLQATYPGDANYSSSVATVAFAINKAATVTTLSATPSVLTPGTLETLTASVAPLNTSTTTYTITGTVAFYDGNVLLGTAPLTSNTATLGGLSLSTAAAHSITAVYSGDASWATSSSSPVILTPLLLADSVALTVSPANVAPGQVVTLVATVTPAVAPSTTSEQNPTGNVIFYNGTTVIGTVALVAGPNHTATATLLSASLPGGNDVLSAFYVGDSFYQAGTSNPITITVLDFSITPAGTNPPTNLTIVKGSTGQASFVVSGLGGFNNQIQVVCAVPSQDDMTCTPSPQQVTPTTTITFTIQTFAAGGPTASNRPASVWPRALSGTALATLIVFVLPFGRRARIFTNSVRNLVIFALLLTGAGLAGIGCSTSVASLPVSNGTPLGVATLKITGAAYIDNTVVSHSVFLTVNVIPPGGSAATVRKGIIRK